VTTGMKDNIAYINDRNGQLKNLEKRKADLEKQLDELQGRGSQSGSAGFLVPLSARGASRSRRDTAKRTTSLTRTYQTFVQEKRPIPKLPLGPVVFWNGKRIC